VSTEGYGWSLYGFYFSLENEKLVLAYTSVLGHVINVSPFLREKSVLSRPTDGKPFQSHQQPHLGSCPLHLHLFLTSSFAFETFINGRKNDSRLNLKAILY
jgi:hypothetical protein